MDRTSWIVGGPGGWRERVLEVPGRREEGRDGGVSWSLIQSFYVFPRTGRRGNLGRSCVGRRRTM